MSTNERDTHFQNAANLLVLRIDGLSVRYKDWPDWRELDRQIKRLIAQFAYDLVEHTLEHTIEEMWHTPEDVPDLTEWPPTHA